MDRGRGNERAHVGGGPWSEAWKWYLVLAGVLSAAYAALPPEPAKLVMWPAIGWSAVAAMVVGVRLHRPSSRRAWYLMIAGAVTLIVGDNLYSYRSFVQHVETPFPSYVDIVYLTMYPLLVAGLTLLIRSRTPGRDRASVLDAAIITTGLGLLSWVTLIAPYVRSHEMGVAARLVAIAYPLGDVALLAIAIRLAVGVGRRSVAFWLLTGSIVPLLIADSLYGWINLTGAWHEHHLVDAGWILFYVGWGTAALHPSMRDLSIRTSQASHVTGRRLALVGSAAFVPPAVLLFQVFTGAVVDGISIGIGSATLFALVLSRTAELAKEAADNHSEARFRALVTHASDAIVVVDDAGDISYKTPSAERVLGRRAEELLHHPIADLLTEHDRRQLDVLLATIGTTTTVEWQVAARDGTTRDLEVVADDLRSAAGINGIVLTMRDITERNALDEELRRQALRDTLTGLANRSLFLDRISQTLARAARHQGEVAVLLLDLDDFKLVNDSLGHPAGDGLLVAVAGRLTSILKAGDTVARVGGDEFALLLENGDVQRGVVAIAERVQAALCEPFRVGHHVMPVSASIGIAVGSSTATPDQLLRDADLAMYVAKRNGKARYEWFAPEMHVQAQHRLEVASELQGAIDSGDLVLHYQPIVAVPTGRTVGVEALVRWNHPRRGLLLPDKFIPIAESTGLVVPLGRWVLEEACRQTHLWQQAGLVDDSFYVSVNLSARHFHDHTVVGDVVRALDASELPGRALLIEITESALETNLDPDGTALGALKGLGARVAIDDFGTGYSSLGRLASFPIDVIKIDKSFVDRVAVDATAATMVRSVVTLSESLGMQAVAEGVEDAEQLSALERLGCTTVQGFLFSRPVPAADMTRALEAQGLCPASQR